MERLACCGLVCGLVCGQAGIDYYERKQTLFEGFERNDSRIMNTLVRDETAADQRAIFQLTKRAFATMPFSQGDEQHLINALRKNGALAISLVAVQDERVVGHIAFSPATSSDPDSNWFALGPVAVEPELQGQRIGSALIDAGIQRLTNMGAAGCVLTGDPNYYSRFGFKPFPNLCPPGEPPEYFMILPLGCASPTAVVEFHPLFHSNTGEDEN